MKKYFQTPWGLRETIGITLLVFFLIIAALFALSERANSQQIITDPPFYFLLLTFATLWAILLLPTTILTALKHKLKAGDWGFRKFSVPRTLKVVLASYLLFHLINALVVTFMFYTNIQIPGYQAQELFLPIIGDDNTKLAILGVMVVFIAPIIEEIFFRGFLFRSLTNHLSFLPATLISAFIFAASHLQFSVIIPIFILGLIINHLTYRTKSLWPAITFHILNNAIVFTIEVLIIKGVIPLEQIVG